MCTKVKPWLCSFPLLLFNISNAAISRGWTEGRTSGWDLTDGWQPPAAACPGSPDADRLPLWLQLRHGTFFSNVAKERHFLAVHHFIMNHFLSFFCSPRSFFPLNVFFFFDGVLQLNAFLFAEKKADDEQKICAWVLFWQHKSIYGCFLKITHNYGFGIVHKWNLDKYWVLVP